MGVCEIVASALALTFSLQFFTTLLFVEGWVNYDTNELTALQSLWQEWKGTPDVKGNLAGWKPNGPNETAYPCFSQSWRGVLCHSVLDKATGNSSAWVVGLTLSDTFLTGQLPPAIGNFSNLISLTLTGNYPSLNGSLPEELGNLSSLNTLDLHSNGFTGPVPGMLVNLNQLQELDLSGNQLDGKLPDFRTMSWLRNLALSNNLLSGNMNQQLFQNMNYLITVDLSGNRLTGPFPNLNTTSSLHSLNFSRNQLSGEIDPTSIFHVNASKLMTLLDLSYNNFTGPLPNLSLWSTLYALDLSYNDFIPGPFPEWLINLNTQLKILALNGISLTNALPLAVLNGFTKLDHLMLDDNNINGTLNISNFSSGLLSLRTCYLDSSCSYHGGTLQMVSLMNNNITDVTYDGSSVKDLGTVFRLQGNPFCRSSTPASNLKTCVCEQYCSDTFNQFQQSNAKVIIITTTVAGLVLSIVIAISVLFVVKNRANQKYLLLAVHQKFAEYDLKPTLYSYGEISKGTQDFNQNMKLGQGAYGVVYKGQLYDGNQVAVKQLLASNQQSMDDFLNEVVLLTGVKHRNLVKLKGCCLRGQQRLLVYEYVENSDLAATLFDQGSDLSMGWPIRLNICLGVAHGLHYLHALLEPRIIHRDIKASNILLDKNLHAKISDFGLALLFPDEKSNIMTMHIAGTKGYLAPEYATLGQLSEKNDVYSFGVLLLEVVSGRRNIDATLAMEKTYLTEWAWRLHNEGRLMDLIDPALCLQYGEELEVHRVINIALLCLQIGKDRRPSMAHVVAMLQGDMEVVLWKEIYHTDSSESYNTVLGVDNARTSLVTINKENCTLPLHSRGSQSYADVLSNLRTVELNSIRAR